MAFVGPLEFCQPLTTIEMMTYLFDEFFNLIPLVGSFTQTTSVPSITIPVWFSVPSNVETDRTVAFKSCPR